MKTGKIKSFLLISAAAASRLFIKIALLDMAPDRKCSLMTTVSRIIEGKIEISPAYFEGEAEEEIRVELEKAVKRSATARAVAARRKEEQLNATIDSAAMVEAGAVNEVSVSAVVSEHETISLVKESENKTLEPEIKSLSEPRRRKRRRRGRRRAKKI